MIVSHSRSLPCSLSETPGQLRLKDASWEFCRVMRKMEYYVGEGIEKEYGG